MKPFDSIAGFYKVTDNIDTIDDHKLARDASGALSVVALAASGIEFGLGRPDWAAFFGGIGGVALVSAVALTRYVHHGNKRLY